MNYKYIEIVPYNPNWSNEFLKEAVKIKKILGDNCLEIHHIGSTAVPGLSAKPIVDMLPIVKDILEVDKVAHAMKDFGYEVKGEFGIPFRRFFAKAKDDTRTHNVHIFEKGSSEVDRHIMFRNWMIRNSKDCNAYAKLKIKLAKKFSNDAHSYSLGKDDFISEIDGKSGWNGYRFVVVLTPRELQEYHRIRRSQIFEPINMIYDEKHQDLTADNHFHLVLYYQTKIVSVAHVELLNKKEAAIRSLATDDPYKLKGHAKQMMYLIEKWVKHQGRQVIKLHANLNAEIFYRKLGYSDMEFNDTSISSNTIDLGKKL